MPAQSDYRCDGSEGSDAPDARSAIVQARNEQRDEQRCAGCLEEQDKRDRSQNDRNDVRGRDQTFPATPWAITRW